MKKVLMVYVILGVLISSGLVFADDVPSPPHRFKGYVFDENNNHAADDTNVSGLINNVYYNTTVKNGKYGYPIETEEFLVEGEEGDLIYFFVDGVSTQQTAVFEVGGLNIDFSSNLNFSMEKTHAITPENDAIDVERPPSELSVYVFDAEQDTLDVYLKWRTHEEQWVLLTSFSGVTNGIYSYIPPYENDWIWGNTQYIWSIHVNDGTSWTNETYTYTTGGSRYDVNNDNKVNFQDAGLAWIHRTSEVPYDGLYDVNQDGKVNFQDAGLTWINRD